MKDTVKELLIAVHTEIVEREKALLDFDLSRVAKIRDLGEEKIRRIVRRFLSGKIEKNDIRPLFTALEYRQEKIDTEQKRLIKIRYFHITEHTPSELAETEYRKLKNYWENLEIANPEEIEAQLEEYNFFQQAIFNLSKKRDPEDQEKYIEVATKAAILYTSIKSLVPKDSQN